MSIMKLLLRHRADVNEGSEDDDITPFHVAAAHGDVDFLDYLLQRGKADILNNTGVLLQKAMVNENEEVFKFVVKEMERAVKRDKRRFHVRAD